MEYSWLQCPEPADVAGWRLQEPVTRASASKPGKRKIPWKGLKHAEEVRNHQIQGKNRLDKGERGI